MKLCFCITSTFRLIKFDLLFNRLKITISYNIIKSYQPYVHIQCTEITVMQSQMFMFLFRFFSSKN